MKRREFISISAASSVWALSGCGSSGSDTSSDTGDSNPPPSGATGLITGATLTIPPLLNPALINGVKQFDLSIQENTHKFYEEFDTNTFAINGSYLGPTLLLRNGEMVSINFQNNLSEITTMHGHGMHLPANMDGGPHQLIEPNSIWSAEYTVNQRACTNWYHPHQKGNTSEHVYKGLAGMIIIEDEESLALALPKTYGTDDIPLVIQDRVFDSLGQFDYSPTTMEIRNGYRGDTFLTNGQIAPRFSAKSGLLRLRLLNGSNAGLYEFSFSDSRQFNQIASDNSFLEQPVSLNSVLLSPGERAEIIVDLGNDSGSTVELQVLEQIDRRNSVILSLDVNSEVSDVTILPAQLTTLETVDETLATNTRRFTLEGTGAVLTINGVEMDINVINESVPINQTEIWEVTNTMNAPHNFHIHATYFRALDRNGDPSQIDDNEKGHKDTIFIPANATVRFLVTMIDYADENGMYMYHCHFLEHEDAGMMGQFVVTG